MVIHKRCGHVQRFCQGVCVQVLSSHPERQREGDHQQIAGAEINYEDVGYVVPVHEL